MKIIEVAQEKKKVPFKDLKPGDVFRHEGNLYMKETWIGSNTVAYATRLETSEGQYLGANTVKQASILVEPIKAEIRILEE